MSKSLGNTTAPQDIIKQYGADILRLWVAQSDYSDDLRIGKEIINSTVDNYRKLRNTIRWLLGNLAHRKADETVDYRDMPELEQLILHRLKRPRCPRARRLRELRLQAHRRRAQQLHEHRPLGVLLRYPQGRALLRPDLLGPPPRQPHRARSRLRRADRLARRPILVFTMEEAWLERHPGADSSVHLREFPKLPGRVARRQARREVGGDPRGPQGRHRRPRNRSAAKSASAPRSKPRRRSTSPTTSSPPPFAAPTWPKSRSPPTSKSIEGRGPCRRLPPRRSPRRRRGVRAGPRARAAPARGGSCLRSAPTRTIRTSACATRRPCANGRRRGGKRLAACHPHSILPTRGRGRRVGSVRSCVSLPLVGEVGWGAARTGLSASSH